MKMREVVDKIMLNLRKWILFGAILEAGCLLKVSLCNLHCEMFLYMKGIKFISLLAILMVVSVCNAQVNQGGDFEKAMKQLLMSGVLGNSFDPKQAKPGFVAMAAKVVGQQNAEAKTQEYMDKQMADDMMSIMLPYYKETMSVADAAYLFKKCNTPEGKTAAENCAILTGSDAINAEMTKVLTPVMMNVLLGKSYEKVKTVDCPESYKVKCGKYLEATGVGSDMIESVLSAIGGMAAQQMSGGDAEKVETVLNRLKTFMVESIPTIYLNMSYGKISEADFDFYINLYSTPAGKNFITGNKALVKDIMSVSMNLMKKFNDWLQANK